MTEAMQRRARRVRERAAVRSWEYRQRHRAKGVWFRLRRVLADAAAVYVIPEREARRLLDEGVRSEPVGAELVPPKTLLFVSEAQLESIQEKRSIPVSLGQELLEATALALVRFP